MSWSYSNIKTEQTEEGLRAALDAALDGSAAIPVDKQQPGAPEEAGAELEAAIKAADAIFESGAVGNGVVSVNLSGHARPGNEPDGSAPDGISVSVYRTT